MRSRDNHFDFHGFGVQATFAMWVMDARVVLGRVLTLPGSSVTRSGLRPSTSKAGRQSADLFRLAPAMPSCRRQSTHRLPSPFDEGANIRRTCYPFGPMSAKSCSVGLTDPQGIRHTVEVTAESLFEAAAIALAAFKKSGWTDPVGSAARLEVEVRELPVRHTVSVLQIQRWLRAPRRVRVSASGKIASWHCYGDACCLVTSL